jgi:outer membrane lipoprotein-sorting protein
MSTSLWDRASWVLVPVEGLRRAEITVLAPGLPDVATLFTFMRDAELRFQALRMRVEETNVGIRGDRRTVHEVSLRHPGEAKVISTDPDGPISSDYQVWISDGEMVRTYSGAHRLGTERPVRRRVVGLDDPDLPGRSTVYEPVTALPMESVVETLVHPGGFAQNVLATGECWIGGSVQVAGREAILLECDHPRTIEIDADRPDHHFQLSVDRETGIVIRLVETIGGSMTRSATVTNLGPDAALPPSAFVFTFPSGTTLIY